LKNPFVALHQVLFIAKVKPQMQVVVSFSAMGQKHTIYNGFGVLFFLLCTRKKEERDKKQGGCFHNGVKKSPENGAFK
jgi:hypothetical protein